MADDSHRLRSGRVLGEDVGPDKARRSRISRPPASQEQKRWSICGSANGAGVSMSPADRARPAAIALPMAGRNLADVGAGNTRSADQFSSFARICAVFGDSEQADWPHGPNQHATDMLALMDAWMESTGIVGIRPAAG